MRAASAPSRYSPRARRAAATTMRAAASARPSPVARASADGLLGERDGLGRRRLGRGLRQLVEEGETLRAASAGERRPEFLGARHRGRAGAGIRRGQQRENERRREAGDHRANKATPCAGFVPRPSGGKRSAALSPDRCGREDGGRAGPYRRRPRTALSQRKATATKGSA